MVKGSSLNKMQITEETMEFLRERRISEKIKKRVTVLF
jgi:hypothetical protein